MSLIVTMFVREGMVMSSDSRLTLNSHQGQPGTQIVQQLAVSQSDTNNKTFLAPNNIGISTCGAADINGVPIAGFIESFIDENLQGQPTAIEVDQVPTLLLNYFRALPVSPATIFHVGGYKKEQEKYVQHVYVVDIQAASITRVNLPGVFGEQGAAWNGETDILACKSCIFKKWRNLSTIINLLNSVSIFYIARRYRFFRVCNSNDYRFYAFYAQSENGWRPY